MFLASCTNVFSILYSSPLDAVHSNVTAKHLSIISVPCSAIEALCVLVPPGKHGSMAARFSFLVSIKFHSLSVLVVKKFLIYLHMSNCMMTGPGRLV